MSTDNTISELNKLVQINLDAHHGYREAAKGVADVDLKKVFNEYSVKRQKNAYTLKNQVKLMGDEPTESGSVKASLHRTWLAIKGDISDNNEKALLEECIRGEEEAVETYEEALQAAVMPASIRTLVSNQYQEVKTALRQMKEWKKLFEEKDIIIKK